MSALQTTARAKRQVDRVNRATAGAAASRSPLHVASQAATWLMGALFLAPFLLFFLNTFKDKAHIFDAFYMPDITDLSNYRTMMRNTDFFASLSLTVVICAVTLFFIVLLSSMAGYIISRSERRWIKWMYALFAAGQIIPAQSSMLPLYKLGVATHLINTPVFLIIIYVAGGTAFASLFFAAFTRTIPQALEESAFIDGCGRYQTFFRIILPLLKPATATIVTTTVYWYWNDFQGPLIYLNAGKVAPLMMSVYKFMGANATVDWGPVYALCFLSAIPMILFFLFTQKYLLKGLVVGSVKG